MKDPRERLTPEQKAAMKIGHQIGQGFVSDDQFHKRFKKLVQTAKETFERDGYHSHMMIGYLRNEATQKMVIVPAMFADWPPPDGRKFEAMQGLGVKLAGNHPGHTLIMVAHISEGWMAKYKPEEITEDGHLRKAAPQASQRPDRIEVLTISLTTQDLRQSSTNPAIFRDEAGKFKRWGKKHLMENIYDPDYDFHPMAEGDQLAFNVIGGYIRARASERGKR